MSNVQYIPKDKGAFVLEENGERIAEMVVDITGGKLSVYHTGVKEEVQGQGIGSKLVDALAGYARENSLQVVPYCPFVKTIFKRHPNQYDDVWDKNAVIK